MLKEQLQALNQAKETFNLASRLTKQSRRMAIAKASKMIRK